LPLSVFAEKYAEGVASHYLQIDVNEYAKGAELLLEFLSEVDAGEDAASILGDYCYFKIHFEKHNVPRKMKPMFGSVEDGVKKPEASIEQNLKGFRAYTFMWRAKTAEKAPVGWTLSGDSNVPKLSEIASIQKSMLDVL
jgi:hypothetical protein